MNGKKSWEGPSQACPFAARAEPSCGTTQPLGIFTMKQSNFCHLLCPVYGLEVFSLRRVVLLQWAQETTYPCIVALVGSTNSRKMSMQVFQLSLGMIGDTSRLDAPVFRYIGRTFKFCLLFSRCGNGGETAPICEDVSGFLDHPTCHKRRLC